MGQINRETIVKLIKHAEISSRILTLLDESDQRVIIVPPYMKISKWRKFVNKVNELRTRRILTEIYIRDDPENTATWINWRCRAKRSLTCTANLT